MSHRIPTIINSKLPKRMTTKGKIKEIYINPAIQINLRWSTKVLWQNAKTWCKNVLDKKSSNIITIILR
jgi:uncharacterized alpha/beta hydrolase family protein